MADLAGRPGAGGVLIWDRCPAYITRERFERNQRQLADNQARQDSRGIPRGGAALLPGLLYCGRCGARLSVSYPEPTRQPEYVCAHRWKMYGEAICQWISGKVLDRDTLRRARPTTPGAVFRPARSLTATILHDRLPAAPDRSALEMAWRLRNASLTEFVFTQNRFTLDSFNSVPHLADPALWTYR